MSEQEPGFLIVSFEAELEKLTHLVQFSEFENQYRIIFLPSWQPFYSKAVSILDARAKRPYFLMPSAFSEESLVQGFSSKAVFLPFHAASWVNADFYPSPAGRRPFDFVMVANFGEFKRHWKLFDIMKQLPGTTALVVGVPLGKRTRETIASESALFGVQDRIELVEGPSQEELRGLLAQGKLFCAFSYKEGSFIAVAEALMAGTPVAMFNYAQIGSRAYINDKTGFLIRDGKHVAVDIKVALAETDRVCPQDWAKSNISAQVNCHRLNQYLVEWSTENRLKWTRDILPFYCQRFGFKSFNREAEAFRKSASKSLNKFGIELA